MYTKFREKHWKVTRMTWLCKRTVTWNDNFQRTFWIVLFVDLTFFLWFCNKKSHCLWVKAEYWSHKFVTFLSYGHKFLWENTSSILQNCPKWLVNKGTASIYHRGWKQKMREKNAHRLLKSEQNDLALQKNGDLKWQLSKKFLNCFVCWFDFFSVILQQKKPLLMSKSWILVPQIRDIFVVWTQIFVRKYVFDSSKLSKMTRKQRNCEHLSSWLKTKNERKKCSSFVEKWAEWLGFTKERWPEMVVFQEKKSHRL